MEATRPGANGPGPVAPLDAMPADEYVGSCTPEFLTSGLAVGVTPGPFEHEQFRAIAATSA